MSDILQTLWHQQEIAPSQIQMEINAKAKLASGNFLWSSFGLKKTCLEKKPVSLEGAYSVHVKVYILISIIICKITFQGWVLEKQILSFENCRFLYETCYQFAP